MAMCRGGSRPASESEFLVDQCLLHGCVPLEYTIEDTDWFNGHRGVGAGAKEGYRKRERAIERERVYIERDSEREKETV